MLRTINLSELTNRAGLSQVNVAEAGRGFAANRLKAEIFRQNINQDPEPEADLRSYLGTPVYSNLIIPSGQYRNNENQVISYSGIRLDTILFEVIPTKNIIRTAINGTDRGTVKQYISLGDYEIRGSGILTGSSFETAGGQEFNVERLEDVPELEIRKLNEIFKVPQEIEVVSEFLDFFGISTVVVQSMGIAQIEGYRDSLLFNIDMLSDTPIELI